MYPIFRYPVRLPLPEDAKFTHGETDYPQDACKFLHNGQPVPHRICVYKQEAERDGAEDRLYVHFCDRDGETQPFPITEIVPYYLRFLTENEIGLAIERNADLIQYDMGGSIEQCDRVRMIGMLMYTLWKKQNAMEE